MKRNLIFKISLVICIGFYTLSSYSQQVNTLYFMDNVPIRHTFNPAFQTYSNFYFGLPILGYTQAGIGNNSLTLKDLIYKQNGQSIWFLNKNGDKNKFYNALKPITLIQGDLQINLIDFGFRTGASYWTIGVSQKMEGQLGIPKDFTKLLLFGTPDIYNNNYDLKNLDGDFSMYTEAALGYSLKINEKLTVGAKAKFLVGNFNASLTNSDFNLNAGADQWTLKGNSTFNFSSPINIVGSSLQTLQLNAPSSITDWIKPCGLGGGVDLGITFKPINELTLSAAVVDLGMIKWTRNVKNIDTNVDFAFSGLNTFDNSLNLDYLTVGDTIFKAFSKSTSYIKSTNSYTTYTSPKINIGAEYSFLEDKLSLGLLSRTYSRNHSFYEELTASVNGRPTDWFNLSLSYSVFNGRMSSIGAGLGLRTGFLNWFIAADYVPLITANLPVTLGPNTFDTPIAYNTKGYNFAFGVNIVFGNRKDDDHDGVVDSKDKCPETPFSVVVDMKGCPLDTDGDGVPDYLDKCAKTPPEAYNRIDQNGCPVDNDEDGVPDYIDKCPDTPKEAAKFVDKFGCVLDTDKDGVFDYKDSCANTPIGMKVDTLGCPFDTDGDGVIDALDKCPDTPIAARGYVDSIGCTLDKDADGVPDYLDKCPQTPIQERQLVDSVGCTIVAKLAKVIKVEINKTDSTRDSDGDGVIDILDKCPKTPPAALGFVDQNGCPIDSDGDGVPDYLDNCPKVAGSAANKGCPDIKKEAKNLFQKALQGIQFETASYEIKPLSYNILNQIAGVMIANPTYIVEIRGHTDNAGKSAVNLILSQNRAKSVMKYLINKGVDAKRMTANGYGDTLPIATNKTDKGKSINRRVEFVVTFEEITFE